ncbi:MAG: putative DNA binding domain-containing protein [Anaerolineaceae bacterium]|nr:putative DNA binding domain-containing protein [Anaerolineaceae bacterium]
MSITPDDVLRLAKSDRGNHTDWLADGCSAPQVAAVLAAMANGQGGTLLLGVTGEPGVITGVRHAAEMVDCVLQAALSIEPPLIIPLPEVVRTSGKAVVVVSVPPGMPQVYAFDGRYLTRVGVQNIPLKTPALRRLIVARGNMSFETEIARRATRDDLDWELARAYVAGLSGMGETGVEKALVKRGCLAEENGKFVPTQAGLLLFGKDPQQFIRGADITAVRFAGETMSDTFTRQDITGTLPEQIRRAETFLVDHLRKGVQLGATMARNESFEYPMEAARELVVNAVAHRDYQISGDGIRLFIFSDRMEVISPGKLPGPVTIANIKDERFSRNPAIVQVLSDMRFIERLGYGVDRVIDLMAQQQLRAPEFEETGGGFRVVLHNQAVQPEEPKPVAPAIQFRGEYEGMEINPRQETALVFLHTEGNNSRITNSDLQQLHPDVHPETIRRDLADLVTKSILKKIGQKRGSYYVLDRD